MSKKQYEDFLVDIFLPKVKTNLKIGERVHFKSPDDANSLCLYQAFVRHSQREIAINSDQHQTLLPVVDAPPVKIIPVLHADRGVGFTENYISLLRDIISTQEGECNGCILLVIHNSSLDTLNNSSRNLSEENDIWNPASIRDALLAFVPEHAPDYELSKSLLNHQFKSILADDATMFGFKDLYNAVQDGRIEFRELGLLNDPAIIEWDDGAQIERRLSDNKKLHDQIAHVLQQYPTELEDKLKELDFGEKFIEQHFKNADPDSCLNDLEYGLCVQEQRKNREDLLELETDAVDVGTLLARSKGEAGAAALERHFIIEMPAGQAQCKLTLSFTNGQLKDSEVKLKKGPKGTIAKANNRSNKRTVLDVTMPFSHEISFFSVELSRPKPKENYKFRILLVPEKTFYFEDIRNCFLIKPAQQLITLQTDSNRLQVAASGLEQQVKDINEEFDIQAIGFLNYEEIINATDRLSFSLRNGEHKLKFDIEGAVSTDTLTLPLLLDKNLFSRLFSDEFYGVYNPLNSKVALDGKEHKPRSKHQDYLEAEAEMLHSSVLSKPIAGRAPIALQDLAEPFPELYKLYQRLFEYLTSRKTLLSLTAWGPSLLALLDQLVAEYIRQLELIEPKKMLSAEQALLVNLGFMTVNEQECMTPFHPLNLSYFVALVKAFKADETQSFKTLPSPTVKRLNAEGLLPFNWHSIYDFTFTQAVRENPIWLALKPSKQTQLSYIQPLVKNKISEFVEAFSSLFSHGSKETLFVNSINNGYNKELFLGLVDFMRNQSVDHACRIHVSLYDAELQHCFFDDIADAASYEVLKSLCELGADKDSADSIIDLIKSRVTYSKFILPANGDNFAYAHLSFIRNNTPVKTSPVDILAEKSGVSCHGLLAGETAYHDQQTYFTTSGLCKIDTDSAPQLQIIKRYGSLSRAVWAGQKYDDGHSLALKVSSQLKQLLNTVYEDSIWTVIIDPKVTLDFFQSDQDVVLIHYSDNYTNSANYDAITVTKRRDFYDQILAQGVKGLIDEFNAFNGEWLLKMLTLPDNERREKKSIIGAYKYINCLLYHSDITWVPLSVAEMLRVAGNIGLKMSDADFSRYSQGIRRGAISDDVLFVGFKEMQMYLLPLEVKVGKKQKHDKGVRQALELKRYLVEQLFGRQDLAGHLYRGLFIRQILMQIDKYNLYKVYPANYFNPITDIREQWLQGDYQLADITGYPKGFMLAFFENENYVNEEYELEQGILQVKLPGSYQNKFISTPLQTLLADCSSKALCYIEDKYILSGQTEATEIKLQVPSVIGQEETSNESSVMTSAGSELVTEVAVTTPVALPVTDREVQVVAAATPTSSLENCRVLIGHNPKTQEAVYWEYGHPGLANRHLIIFGNSGQGKTYCIQGLLMELAKHSINSMVVDYTNGFLPEHLEKEFIERVNPQTDLIANQPLKLNPFKKQKNIVAGMELTDKSYDVASRVASVFKSVYSTIGDQQLPTLIKVIEEGLNTFGSQYTFDHMVKALEELDQTGQKVANKLMPLVKANVFAFDDSDGWKDIYESKDSVCRLIQMARLSRDVWLAAVEFILWDLYSHACLHGSKNKPLPIVLDEVQNLDHRLESPLGKMLTEGRKYGISLILATQTMSNLEKEAQDRLFQASHKLFFAPAMTEVQTYAKLLEQAVPGTDKKHWINELSKLKKGECLSVGAVKSSSGILTNVVRLIKISSLAER